MTSLYRGLAPEVDLLLQQKVETLQSDSCTWYVSKIDWMQCIARPSPRRFHFDGT